MYSGMGSRFGQDPRPTYRDPVAVDASRDSGKHSTGSRIVATGWKGAEVSRLTSSSPSVPLTADDYLKRKHRILVGRSRHVCQNVEQIAGYLMDLEAGVLGKEGLRLQPLAKLPDRGDDEPELDKDLANAVRAAWKRWVEPEHCDVQTRLSFREIGGLHLRGLVTDGEFLARTITGSGGGDFGLALQVLDPIILPSDYERDDLPDGRFIRFGIEYNKYGRPLYYHVLDVNPNKLSYRFGNRTYRKIPAGEIIHDFIPLMAGQKRGVPHTATTLFRTLLIDGYDEAAVTNARVGAQKMGFFTSPDGMAEYKGEKDADGAIRVKSEPGEFEHLPDGMAFVGWDPTYPHGEYPGFMAEQNRRMSAGLGASYCRLARDMRGVSWSTLRSEELSTEAIVGSIFRSRALRFASTIYRSWAEMALLAGEIRYVSGNRAGEPVDPLELDRVLQHRFRGGRRPWVDPLKETQAVVLQLHNGMESWTGYFEDQGEDVEEVFAEIKRDRDLAQKFGIPIPDPTDATKLLLSQQETESTEDTGASEDADRRLAVVGR